MNPGDGVEGSLYLQKYNDPSTPSPGFIISYIKSDPVPGDTLIAPAEGDEMLVFSLV